MEEPSAPHELGRGKSLIPESPEQPPCRSAADNAAIPYDLIAILVGILVADLIGILLAACGKLPDAVQDDLQHKLQKSCAVSAPVRLS